MARTAEIDGGQWLTYAEAGERFAISAEAARQLARRRGWQRRTPNEPNEPARIYVPNDAYVRPRTAANGVDQPVEQPVPNGDDRPSEPAIRAFEIAIMTLAAQLDRADERARIERKRADRLEVTLADAIAAERIAAVEAMTLRSREDERHRWRFWQRIWWAIAPGNRR